MKSIFNAAGWLLFAIERMAIRGQAWLDDHYPALDDARVDKALDEIADYLSGAFDDARVDKALDDARVDKALDEIADYLSGAFDDARVDRYIDSHRPGMPPRGRR